MSDVSRCFVQIFCAVVISLVLLSIPALFVLAMMFAWPIAVKILLGVVLTAEIIAIVLAILLIFEEV